MCIAILLGQGCASVCPHDRGDLDGRLARAAKPVPVVDMSNFPSDKSFSNCCNSCQGTMSHRLCSLELQIRILILGEIYGILPLEDL